MLNTLSIFNELQEVLDNAAAKKLAGIIYNVYDELHNTVTKSEFNQLTAVVRQLAEAQNRTEIRVEQLAVRVEELAEAQKRTEIRLEELAEAQKRTEIRLEKLAVRVEELAEAQKRTEESLLRLSEDQRDMRKELKETRKQVGGLSMTVGYGLEDRAYKAMPGLLQRDFGIEVTSRLTRKFVRDNKGSDIEVNIVGDGLRNNQKILIAGESKSQLSKNDIDRFIKKKLNRLEGIFPDIFPVLITFMIAQPDVEDYAKEKGIALYYSYDL